MAKLNIPRTRDLLQQFRFQTLFIEELGWDHHNARLEVFVDSQVFALTAIAEKRGMAAFCCNALPDYATRRKIEQQVAKSVHEHLIIYTDATQTTQVWQWVKREAGKPTACREYTYHRNQPGDALIQKLQTIAFSLEEEEKLTIVDVTSRARAAFDMERVTRRFYDRFKTEHAAFLRFLKGIPDEDMQRWYASVMLNRLMFIYFIQKKGFVDNNTNYLRSKLTQGKRHGKDCFYSDFLCPLFFEGFAKKEGERSTATNQLLGKVPYLNGGLFLRHQIEELYGKSIQISDSAFEKLFDFFDQYHWHLDERLLRADNEINPDVLGYIFEKYINQKQMGAYYTKEDITEYISKNTVIPFLFDVARQKCKIAFEGEHSIWRLLQADPDRYIYEAVRRGVIDKDGNVIPESNLPDFVQKGMHDPKARMFDRRYNLGEAFVPDSQGKNLALPTETWREYVERRKRCLELRQRLATGEIRDINDLITYNLNIRQFTQDVIENCEGPELLRAFYHAIEKVTVLDPTCGSGAFLFAALNILEPLYEACLDRMEAFLSDLDRSGEKHRPEKFGDFRRVLERVSQHPNPRYFILKSIIINNLFGVDIMEEAVEICKLRLFLKLVAQVERVEDIEPLPDIDFNIRAGNTLVGFANYDEVKRAVTSRFDFDNTMKRIEEKAQDIDRLFGLFRQQQTEIGGEVTPEDKQELRNRLKTLEDELNRYLAGEYGVNVGVNGNSPAYEKWLASHKPFHWFIEFYGIIKNGGFDVIIGNPPYVELSDIVGQYSIRDLELVTTGNLYSICLERFSHLVIHKGRVGIIVPISAVSTPRMLPLMQLLTREFSSLYISNFAVRPGKLFVGTDMNLTILVGQKKHSEDSSMVYSSRYSRWQGESRPVLFATLAFADSNLNKSVSSVPKIGTPIEAGIMQKILNYDSLSRCRSIVTNAESVYYHSGGRYFRKCIRDQLSNEYKELRVQKGWGNVLICLLSSSFYYWFWITMSDCYHVTRRDIDSLTAPESLKYDKCIESLAQTLIEDLWRNSDKRLRVRADGRQQQEVNFRVDKSKPIVDEIDCVLAEHYGFTDEELDFIINYDIKYRMGKDVEEV